MATFVSVTGSVTAVAPSVGFVLVGTVDAVAEFPWVRTALTAAQVARAAADLPMLVAGNVAGDGLQDPEWRSGGDWTTGLDETESDAAIRQSTRRLFDGVAHLHTMGDGAEPNYILFELDDVAFDVVALVGHNLADIGPTSVRVEIADDEVFSSRLEVLAEWTSDFTRRLVETQLGGGDGYRYSDVRYLRVVFEGGAGNPIRVGEVFLGTRYAPAHAQEIEDDEDAEESLMRESSPARSGEEQRVKAWSRRLNTTLRWRPDDDDYVALFRDWFAATAYGRDAFLWIPTPATDQRLCYLARCDGRLDVVNEGAANNTVSVTIREQAPYVAREQ